MSRLQDLLESMVSIIVRYDDACVPPPADAKTQEERVAYILTQSTQNMLIMLDKCIAHATEGNTTRLTLLQCLRYHIAILADFLHSELNGDEDVSPYQNAMTSLVIHLQHLLATSHNTTLSVTYDETTFEMYGLLGGLLASKPARLATILQDVRFFLNLGIQDRESEDRVRNTITKAFAEHQAMRQEITRVQTKITDKVRETIESLQAQNRQQIQDKQFLVERVATLDARVADLQARNLQLTQALETSQTLTSSTTTLPLSTESLLDRSTDTLPNEAASQASLAKKTKASTERAPTSQTETIKTLRAELLAIRQEIASLHKQKADSEHIQTTQITALSDALKRELALGEQRVIDSVRLQKEREQLTHDLHNAQQTIAALQKKIHTLTQAQEENSKTTDESLPEAPTVTPSRRAEATTLRANFWSPSSSFNPRSHDAPTLTRRTRHGAS